MRQSSCGALRFGSIGRVLGLLLGLSCTLGTPARAGCFDAVATANGPDAAARFFHDASVLDSGLIMISGGMRLQIFPRSLISLNTISFLDPSTGATSTTFAPGNGSAPAAPVLQQARSSHTQTTLGDGRVLIAGGHVGASGTSPGSATSSVELFDPETGVVASGPAMSAPRAGHSATMRPDGRAVIAGGSGWQVFDPGTSSWSGGGALARSRTAHAAVLLPDGDVLLIGGQGASGPTLERIDVDAGTSTLSTALLDVGVDDLAAAALGDGRVLIVGGQSASGDTISDTYLYDPVAESLTAIAAPPGFTSGLADHVLTRLGRFVVTTGGESQTAGADTELAGFAIFDRRAEVWVHDGAMTQAHDDHVALPAGPDRIVVIDGGVGAFGQEIPSNVIETLVVDLSGAVDLDGSGDVGFGDLLMVISAWGPCGAVCDEDVDGDGIVGFSDLLITISAWGPCR